MKNAVRVRDASNIRTIHLDARENNKGLLRAING